MARKINRLLPLGVARASLPGLYADGAGLYLQVGPGGTKSWVFRFMLAGRAREMGLGPLHTVSLADARKRALEARQMRLAGIDPIEHRRAQLQVARAEQARVMTFDEAAEQYVAGHERGWRNAKHGAQWRSTLKTYASPYFGRLNVAEIDTGLVARCLEAIWGTKTETASRVRGRIESVLDWATTRGLRSGENPARWKGHLENILPKRSKVRRVKHHPALRYADIAALLQVVRRQEGIASKALELLVLTATRTSEVLGARWAEFDLDAAVWAIPADRIKAGREHRVPLSPRALELLNEMQETQRSELVFPAVDASKSLSNMALLAVLRRIQRDDLTVHGFRSTFRDWAAEQTNHAREVAEQALAHAIGDKVEAAYRRGDLFEKRRRMMAEWARFCASPLVPAKVARLRSA